MSMSRTIRQAIAFLAAALLLAGCGSSGGSEPLSDAAFSTQGNRICREAGQQRSEDLKAATAESDGSGGTEELADFVEVSLESIEDMAGELSDLEGPVAREKAVAKLVADLDREVEKMKAAPDKPVTSSSFTAANTAARQAGLPDCTI